jgi:hypothetical protein
VAELTTAVYREVTYRLGRVIPDTSDAGRDPDEIAVTGTVTITPVISTGELRFFAEPQPVKESVAPVVCQVVGGVLTQLGVEGVNLLTTDNPLVNPVDWKYRVTHTSMRAGTVDVTFQDFEFQLPADAQPLDLTVATPLTVTGSTLTVQGPPGNAVAEDNGNGTFELQSGTVTVGAGVESVAGKTGAVTLAPTDIPSLTEYIQDTVNGLLGAGSNIVLTYNDTANTLSIASTSAGGSGLDAEAVRDAIGVALIGVGAIGVTVNDAADTITISTTATVNSTDATLLSRTNHTGVQAISTVTGLQAALDAKVATPAGGTDGQLLAKSGSAVTWTDPPTGGGGSGIAGGYGPNWIAASNTVTSVKNAISAAGGLVCDGTADQVQINAQLATYGSCEAANGDYYLSAPVTPAARRRLRGQGPLTRFIGASGLTTAFFSLTADHIWLSDFLMIAGAEAAATDHILANVTSSTGFITGADACINLSNLISQNAKGRGIVMTGTNNRDSKINKIHIHNPVSHGMYISSPDGNFEQVVVGTPGGNGIWMDSGSSNWHGVNSKCWYADLDGFLLNGIRGTFIGIEGQDNLGAGIRIIGNDLTVTDWTADSNSFDGGTGVTNVHSGLEVGRTFAQGTSGGFDINIGPGQSWDKNESGRGYNQRAGVRLRTGIRGLTMVGVGTGDPAGTHHNVTGGIVFDTSADLTNAANSVSACLSHRVRINS